MISMLYFQVIIIKIPILLGHQKVNKIVIPYGIDNNILKEEKKKYQINCYFYF